MGLVLPAISALNCISPECFLFSKSFCANVEHRLFKIIILYLNWQGIPPLWKINSRHYVSTSKKGKVTDSESTGTKIMLQLQWRRQWNLFKEGKGRTCWRGKRIELVYVDILPNNISATCLMTCKTLLYHFPIVMHRCFFKMWPSSSALLLDGRATLHPLLPNPFFFSDILVSTERFFCHFLLHCIFGIFLFPCSHNLSTSLCHDEDALIF